MADSKITALDNLTSADPANDMIPIVDVSATPPASGNTKRISINNILACSPTATLASATITGALTVDTTTLVVNPAGYPDRVGIGTASPSYDLEIAGAVRSSLAIRGNFAGGTDIAHLRFINANGSIVGDIYAQNTNGGASDSAFLAFNTVSSGTSAERYRIGSDGVATWSNVGGVAGTAMTLNANGLGIGVTPSAWGSNYRAVEVSGAVNVFGATSDGNLAGIGANLYHDNTNYLYRYATFATMYLQDNGAHQWYTAGVGTANGIITDFATAKMTLDASGNLLVGTTAAEAKLTVLAGASGQSAIFKQPAQNFWCVLAHNEATSGDNSFVMFGTESTFTFRGSITYNRAGGLISYNTTSDYRAKDIIGPVSNSGSLIDSLKVYVGKMKGATIERPMLIAHETQEVAPYAVTGTKDEVDADGNPKYQQMDASALVPLLIAEIQSLRARVQTLETR